MACLPDPRAAANRIKRVLHAVFEATFNFDLEECLKKNLGRRSCGSKTRRDHEVHRGLCHSGRARRTCHSHQLRRHGGAPSAGSGDRQRRFGRRRARIGTRRGKSKGRSSDRCSTSSAPTIRPIRTPRPSARSSCRSPRSAKAAAKRRVDRSERNRRNRLPIPKNLPRNPRSPRRPRPRRRKSRPSRKRPAPPRRNFPRAKSRGLGGTFQAQTAVRESARGMRDVIQP